MKTTKQIFDEMTEEDYIQDMIFLQEAEYDREREILQHEIPVYKRIFSRNIRHKNRINKPIFTNKIFYPYNYLPF